MSDTEEKTVPAAAKPAAPAAAKPAAKPAAPKPAAKPAPSDKKIVGWRCKICSYVYEGSELPDDFLCPLCGHGKDDFEPIYE